MWEERNEASFSSAHQLYGDIQKGKNANYMKVLYERTEDGTTDVHGYYNNLGGCYLRTATDFANDPLEVTDAFGQPYNSNVNYGKYFNIYPSYRGTSNLTGNAFTGVSHVMYNHKVLGRGKTKVIKHKWFPIRVKHYAPIV